jgi:hypothetical protein
VADGADIDVRFITLKLLFCHCYLLVVCVLLQLRYYFSADHSILNNF